MVDESPLTWIVLRRITKYLARLNWLRELFSSLQQLTFEGVWWKESTKEVVIYLPCNGIIRVYINLLCVFGLIKLTRGCIPSRKLNWRQPNLSIFTIIPPLVSSGHERQSPQFIKNYHEAINQPAWLKIPPPLKGGIQCQESLTELVIWVMRIEDNFILVPSKIWWRYSHVFTSTCHNCHANATRT